MWKFWRSSTFIAFCVFVILSILFCHSIFKNITYWGSYDWDQHFLYHGVPRDTLVRFHQFPLWNPYYCGGNVMLANTQARFMSPTFLFVLVFGTVVGLKLEIWFHLLAAMMGMFLLSRQLGMGKYSSYLPPIIFTFSGMYVLHLTVGHTWFMAIVYLPYALLFYLKGLQKGRYGILSGAFIALMILEGGIYPAPHTVLFLVIFSTLLSLKSKSLAPLKVLGIVLLFTFLLSAVKLIPTYEFFRDYPRLVESKDHLSPKMLYYVLFSRTQNLLVRYPEMQLYGWWEYGSYIGFLPVILWLVGSILSFKKEWPLIATGLVFLVLALGDFSKISPWHLLHYAPVFSSHHVPSRFMIGFIFSISIFAGICLTKLKAYAAKYPRFNRVSLLFCILPMAFILCDLVSVNSEIFAQAFARPAPLIKRNAHFSQIKGLHHEMYPAFLRNEGTLNAYEPTHFPTKAIAKTDPNYQGEVFLTAKGEAKISYWSPNKVVVKAKSEAEGNLVLNQNFTPNWKAVSRQYTPDGKRQVKTGKELKPYNGLVSTQVTPKDEQIVFYYLPISFIIGSVISLSGVVLSIIAVNLRRLLSGCQTLSRWFFTKAGRPLKILL